PSSGSSPSSTPASSTSGSRGRPRVTRSATSPSARRSSAPMPSAGRSRPRASLEKLRLALFTDAFAAWPLPGVLEWLAAAGIGEVELGTGGFSPAPHCDLARLLGDAGARRDLLEDLESSGFRLA